MIKNNLFDLLTYKKEFEPIMKSMLEEGFYFLQDKEYTVFDVLEYDGCIAGYLAGDYVIMNKMLSVILDLFYVLPKYRDKGLFCDYIQELDSVTNGRTYLNLPNRFAIESLMKNGLAMNVTSNIVKSSIPLTYLDEDGVRIVSYYYDLGLCGVISFDDCGISPVLDVDDMCFGCGEFRDCMIVEDYIRLVGKCLFK